MRRIFRALFGVLLVGALLAPASRAEDGPATFAEAKALAEKENKPLLIDLYAVW